MRYRVKEFKGRVIIKIDGKAREDDAASARRSLSALLRRPGVKAILYLAGLREIGVPELGVLDAIRQEVRAQGGTVRVGAVCRHRAWSRLSVPRAARRLRHRKQWGSGSPFDVSTTPKRGVRTRPSRGANVTYL